MTRHQRHFFVIAWLAAAYLALDEALELNETYSYNLEGLGRLRDLDLVAYGVPGLAFAYVFRDVLFASRRALLLAAAGLGAFALAQILDAFVGRRRDGLACGRARGARRPAGGGASGVDRQRPRGRG